MSDLTGVVVLMASDADALAALAEVAVEEGWLEGTEDGLVSELKTAARRARAALTRRLAVMGGQNDRLVNGDACVVRLQDAGR